MTVTATFYDADYYGVGAGTPKANYENYGPHSIPHWSMPLAQWIVTECEGPYLDVGGAYGHLCRDINRLIDMDPSLKLADGRPSIYASAVDCSAWAVENRVTPMLELADARAMPFADDTFGTVISLDVLEHFEPDETVNVLKEMRRVAYKGHLAVHLIGWPKDDNHFADPSHVNHERYEWYVERLRELGYTLRSDLVERLDDHPVWRRTDWRGRWLVMQMHG